MLLKLFWSWYFVIDDIFYQPTNKKGASAKGGVSKKSDAPAQTKSSKSAETPEDVEVEWYTLIDMWVV